MPFIELSNSEYFLDVAKDVVLYFAWNLTDMDNTKSKY
jgi:hypothetical protein